MRITENSGIEHLLEKLFILYLFNICDELLKFSFQSHRFYCENTRAGYESFLHCQNGLNCILITYGCDWRGSKG